MDKINQSKLKIIKRHQDILNLCAVAHSPKEIVAILGVERASVAGAIANLRRLGKLAVSGTPHSKAIKYIANDFEFSAIDYYKLRGNEALADSPTVNLVGSCRYINSDNYAQKHLDTSRLKRVELSKRGTKSVNISTSLSRF